MLRVMPLQVPVDGWTVDDLPDDGLRYELVDGGLLVTPPPRPRHQEAALALAQILRPALPREWRAVPAQGLYFGPRDYRVPDVLVYDREASRRDSITPADVHLVVEVMSPGSVSTDRVTKPAQYAAAGIPHFWRLELEPLLLLVVHRLSGESYEVAGSHDDEVALDEPVSVSFRLAELLG
jgi:Uma2 family endonuclease